MVIGVNANGASISPDPRIARDYSQPVQFTLTAPDGAKVVYTVTVKGAECLTPAAPPVTPPVVPPVIPPVVPPVVPTACTAAAIGSTGYSLVFKGCSAANVAEYYDKTECVRDNASGLIWQGQTPAGTGFRANDRVFTNYDSTTELQKRDTTPFTSNYLAPTETEVDADTNSIGFKNAVNASNLCGSDAWRMPTKEELISILKVTETPKIDSIWFPNTYPFYYWTSSPRVFNADGRSHQQAWDVDFRFSTGYFTFHDRDLNSGYGLFPVRLVR
jgi:Protein of unknown function (DUF1566)